MNEKKGIVVYHGGRKFSGPVDILPKASKNAQNGPGSYTTTNLYTAQKYAKGGGVVHRIILSPETRFNNTDGNIPLSDAIEWVESRSGLRKKKEIIADLKKNSENRADRLGPGVVYEWALLNLCVNHDVLSGEHGPALAAWMVEHGIDAEVERAMKNNEEWVSIFNPNVVIHREILANAGEGCEYELPRVAEQISALLDAGKKPGPKPR